jgi:hypothetical protein
MEEEKCTCGCGKSRSVVIRELMGIQMLNEEQADWTFSEGQRLRSQTKE